MTRRWLALTLELGSLRGLLLSVVKDAEPTPFAALRAGFHRTDHILGSHFRSVIAATTRTPASLAATIAVSTTPNGNVESAFK